LPGIQNCLGEDDRQPRYSLTEPPPGDWTRSKTRFIFGKTMSSIASFTAYVEFTSALIEYRSVPVRRYAGGLLTLLSR